MGAGFGFCPSECWPHSALTTPWVYVHLTQVSWEGRTREPPVCGIHLRHLQNGAHLTPRLQITQTRKLEAGLGRMRRQPPDRCSIALSREMKHLF